MQTNAGLSLTPELTEQLVGQLGGRRAVPVSSGPRPVHVVYGGAHLFKAETIAKLGGRARAAMDAWAGDADTFARTVGLATDAAPELLFTRVKEKLARRPVEAMCIDFEDGYGPRPDAEEDAEAVRAATELARSSSVGTEIGIRIKALSGSTVPRAIRTLDLFLTTLARATSSALPSGFTVTLPKVTEHQHVSALALLLEELEVTLGIRKRIGIELMIESPRALVSDVNLAIPSLLAAGFGRIVALHLGAYDLTSELGVTAHDQRLDHPFCDFARTLLRLSTFATPIGVSDGATTLLPIPPKDASPEESARVVRSAWALHARNVRRAIEQGIFQGWDLHPAQLPARYGALFGFFLAQKDAMTTRLRSFVENATRATRAGQVFDDAATGQGLLSFFARGLACGVLNEDDVTKTGLAPADLSRSFAEIVGSSP